MFLCLWYGPWDRNKISLLLVLFHFLTDFSLCWIFMPTHVGLVFRLNYLFWLVFKFTCLLLQNNLASLLRSPLETTLPARPARRSVQRWSDSGCIDVSHSVTRKHELCIWFTLSYAMMKASLRLAAVWNTKQSGELRGDTVQFIASSSALVLMTQNGNIYRPLTQTATCLLPRYRSKHITENS